MADVSRLPGVFEQIRVVAALRWRILRNSLRKKNNRLDLLGIIILAILSSLLVVGVSIAFYAGGLSFVSRSRVGWMALLYWVIFLFWQVLPIFVAGFGASFEFRGLLRFPLSLTTYYIIGLAYGLSDFSAAASVCWLLSMTAGAAAAKLSVLPAMLLVGAIFLLLNVTLERLISSWLEKLMSRRKSREIFLALFVLSMVSINFINPVAQRYGRAFLPVVQRFLPYLSWLPPALAHPRLDLARR